MRIAEFLSTLEQHPTLNPRLWDDDDQLLPEVKEKLMAIADRFLEFIDLDLEPEDVVIVGAQTGFNYTRHSDLDLHLIFDYGKIKCDQEVEELLDTKRLLFKQQHSIKIRGIPVEPGAEDQANPTVSAAYSVMNSQWLRRQTTTPVAFDEKAVAHWATKWEKIIKAVLKQNDAKTAEKILKMIRKYRKIGLKQHGEFGTENLVYKHLRNLTLIKQLEQMINDHEDSALGI